MKKESNALSGLRIRALTGGEREREVLIPVHVRQHPWDIKGRDDDVLILVGAILLHTTW
jgi:hypothetical protein